MESRFYMAVDPAQGFRTKPSNPDQRQQKKGRRKKILIQNQKPEQSSRNGCS